LLLAFWNSPLTYVAFPLLALGFAGSGPLLSDYLNRHIPTTERATVLSLVELLQSLILIGLEPALGGLAQRFDLQAAFWGGAAFLGVMAALALVPWSMHRRAQGDLATVNVASSHH
jgi:hypothetical protein